MIKSPPGDLINNTEGNTEDVSRNIKEIEIIINTLYIYYLKYILYKINIYYGCY